MRTCGRSRCTSAKLVRMGAQHSERIRRERVRRQWLPPVGFGLASPPPSTAITLTCPSELSKSLASHGCVSPGRGTPCRARPRPSCFLTPVPPPPPLSLSPMLTARCAFSSPFPQSPPARTKQTARQVDRRQSPAQAARNQGCTQDGSEEVGPRHRGRQEGPCAASSGGGLLTGEPSCTCVSERVAVEHIYPATDAFLAREPLACPASPLPPGHRRPP